MGTENVTSKTLNAIIAIGSLFRLFSDSKAQPFKDSVHYLLKQPDKQNIMFLIGKGC